MARLSITLFGTFQVTLDNQPITEFGTDKTRALLAFLAVESSRSHRRDALAGFLWPDSTSAKARQSLRQALSQLNRALSRPDQALPFLLVDRETVQFNPRSDHSLDAAEFAALHRATRNHRHRRIECCLPCIRRLEAMTDLYRGRFLSDFFLGDSNAFEEWAIVQREHLHRQMMEALSHLLEYHERRGQVKRAIEIAYRQVEVEPWREETHRQLMRLLALDGRRSAALAQYRACRRILAEELGAEPTAETTALHRQIADSDGEQPVALARSRLAPLPPLPSALIGREADLADLASLLADPDCRLLTLVGQGGIGKTHLALQVAIDQVGLYCDGVAFVPLAALDAAEHLVFTLAAALNYRFHDSADPEQQLLDMLREKELLLVLDNMEHLLEAADFLARILHHAPGVTLLLTSRERLNLREEWVYELEGLDYPAEGLEGSWQACSSVALFVERARRVERRFDLGEQRAPAVARICRLVEGMPLAVELAAAWMRLRTPEEVAANIERNLDALRASARNVPARHASLHAVFEHSWQLLNADEQLLLGKPFRVSRWL